MRQSETPSGAWSRVRPRAGTLLAALALVAACSGSPAGGDRATDSRPAGEHTPTASPLADCAALESPPPDAGAGPAGAGPAEALPPITLPCFTGGQPVALDRLAGPAVINLWASWCPPCREELPLLQRFAERAAGQVHIVGVVTEDTRTGAASFARDAGVRFPALEDRDGRLLSATGVVGLPATLFVDAAGQVRHLHNAQLDGATLTRLAAEHLQVAAP